MYCSYQINPTVLKSKLQVDSHDISCMFFFNEYIINVDTMFSIIIVRIILSLPIDGACGGLVVKALRYKPAGRGFDSR